MASLNNFGQMVLLAVLLTGLASAYCGGHFEYSDVRKSNAANGLTVSWRTWNNPAQVSSYIYYGTNRDAVARHDSYKAGVFHGTSGKNQEANIFPPYGLSVTSYYLVRSCVTCGGSGGVAYQTCFDSSVMEYPKKESLYININYFDVVPKSVDFASAKFKAASSRDYDAVLYYGTNKDEVYKQGKGIQRNFYGQKSGKDYDYGINIPSSGHWYFRLKAWLPGTSVSKEAFDEHNFYPDCSVSFDYFKLSAANAKDGVKVEWKTTNKPFAVSSYIYYGEDRSAVERETSFKAGVYHGTSGQAMQQNVFQPARGKWYYWKVKSCVTCEAAYGKASMKCVSSPVKGFGLVYSAGDLDWLYNPYHSNRLLHN